MSAAAIVMPATEAFAVPSFSRQMGTGCSTCHTVIPQLTPFGRKFKASGYTLSAGDEITATATDSKRSILELAKNPPLSAMLIASYSLQRDPPAGDKTSDVLAPDQLSLFYAGKIAPGLGGFLQVTYDSQTDHFSMDNMDVRYAHTTSLWGKDLVFGATLNNNPTVSDLWNTTPAWGWPFITSGVWPGEGSNAALVDGTLAQQAVGLGGYAYWNDAVYVEADVYRSAQLGVPRPYDAATPNVIDAVAPYWRAAYDTTWGNHELEVGTYGMYGKLDPGQPPGGPPSAGPTSFLDVAADASYQYWDNPSNTSLTLQTTYIYEHREDAVVGVPQHTANLHTFRIDANGMYKWLGASAGFFMTAGDRDPAIFGTVNGEPDTDGMVLSVMARPWLNTLFVAQYTPYFQFDGSSSNYDGAGRAASDNNMFSLLAWIAF